MNRRSVQARPRARRRALAGALALLVGPLAVLGLSTSAASAEPPFDTEAAITDLAFVDEQTRTGSTATLTGSWSLPDNPTGSAGFELDLPADLHGWPTAFPMTLAGPANEVIGDCRVTETSLWCEVDPDYIAQNPLDLHGAFSFAVRVDTEVTETREVDYDIAGHQVGLTVLPPATACPTDCAFTNHPDIKSGWNNVGSNLISWEVQVGSGTAGMTGGERVVVRDILGPNQVFAERAPRVFVTSTVGLDADGRERPIGYTELPASQYTISSDRSEVGFVAEAGAFYHVRFYSVPTDGGAQRVYANSAEITVENETREVVEGRVTYQEASAIGIGTNVGVFTITKEVIGDDVDLTGVVFSGTYVVTTPDEAEIEGEFTVEADQTWRSPEFPRDSTVHLTEVLPSSDGLLTWAPPVFDDNGFTLVGGQIHAVRLTNSVTVTAPGTGQFSLVKAIDGPGAGQVPEQTVFTVEYAYPAGEGFEAGSGELTVLADGAAVTSEELPGGAVLTLTEATPPAIDGLRWAAVAFSDSEITIEAGELIEVTLTNTAEMSPPPTTPPTTPARPSLPDLGADLPLVELMIAAGLIAVGGTAVMVVRRRTER